MRCLKNVLRVRIQRHFFIIKDSMLRYILHMNLKQLTWVFYRAIYINARVPLSLTKTWSRCDVPRFFRSYMWDTHILFSYRKVDWAVLTSVLFSYQTFNTTTSSQIICQCLYFICNKENIKCQTVDFQPPCHKNGHVSGEWPSSGMVDYLACSWCKYKKTNGRRIYIKINRVLFDCVNQMETAVDAILSVHQN